MKPLLLITLSLTLLPSPVAEAEQTYKLPRQLKEAVIKASIAYYTLGYQEGSSEKSDDIGLIRLSLKDVQTLIEGD